ERELHRVRRRRHRGGDPQGPPRPGPGDPMTDSPLLLDCDVLVGHDVTTGRWGRPENVAKVFTDSGISGGAVAALRAVHFDVPSGNDEARQVADGNGWTTCPVLDLRDPLGAEKELERQLA